eukprot:12931607-Prorocentrum_lima.AAC.1
MPTAVVEVFATLRRGAHCFIEFQSDKELTTFLSLAGNTSGLYFNGRKLWASPRQAKEERDRTKWARTV